MQERKQRSAATRDVEVRGALHQRLRKTFSNDSSTIFLDELGILQGQVRVDIAAVNGAIHGYEIKAAADNLKRFQSQVSAYSKVLDCAAVVVAPKHLDEAARQLPDWWGMIVVEPSGDTLAFSIIRAGRQNPSIDIRAVAELLWHREALDLIERRATLRGLKGKPRSVAWDRLCELYSLDEIRTEVRRTLKARRAGRFAT